jgi:hypothetical protein
MAIKYKGEIKYPPYYQEIARIIGRKRYESNKDLNKRKPRYSRGDEDMSLNVDYLGVLGELIFSYYLTHNGIDHEVQMLFSENPISGWDIMVNGKSFDVKVVNPKYTNFIVNEEAHFKKKMDYYAFVKPDENNTAHVWVSNYSDTTEWNRKELRFAPAFLYPIFYE